ncbi:hypothetical protein VTH06DRAFT_5704 [Thermothelomyces fergusii]
MVKTSVGLAVCLSTYTEKLRPLQVSLTDFQQPLNLQSSWVLLHHTLSTTLRCKLFGGLLDRLLTNCLRTISDRSLKNLLRQSS